MECVHPNNIILVCLRCTDHWKEVYCETKLCNWNKHKNNQIYTVSHKKRDTFIFVITPVNILIILSPSHSQMNCRKRLNKIYHLTLSLLPHYHAKVECFNWATYRMLFNAFLRRIVYLQYLSIRDAKFCFHVYTDQFATIKHCVKIVCPQHTNMFWDMHASDAISQWLRQWCAVKCCSAKCSNDV